MLNYFKLIISLCCVGWIAGCSEYEQEHKKIRQTGFVFCGQQNPVTFNPQRVDNGITVNALSAQLFNSLLILDSKTHQPSPSLATHWHMNELGTEYTFFLRPGVEFQTTQWFTPSRNMNADDVVFSFQRLILSTHPYHLVGHGHYPWFASINFANLIERVEKVDDLTVKFVLTQPDNTFLSNIATGYAVIHSAEYAKQLQIKDEKHQLDALPVGTGPFYLTEFQPHDLIRLYRHEQFWQGRAKMQQVVFDVSRRGTGTLAKLLRHECDVLTAPISSQIPIIQRQTTLILNEMPAMNVAFIALNTIHPALQDQRVRQALSYAINRQNILDSVYYGKGKQAKSLLPPTSWAFQADSNAIRYDRNYAIALLKQAGYGDHLKLTMSVPVAPKAYNPSPRKTAEILKANFADIGVELILISDDYLGRAQFNTMTHSDLLLTGWAGNTGDPDNFLRPLLSCDSEQAGLNVAMWCHPDYDFLLDLALETNQQRYRLNLYKQVQNILNEKFPVIPLAHGVQYQVHDKSLTGFRVSPFNIQAFDLVERRP